MSEDCLFVGYDKDPPGRDKTFLIVGRKKNNELYIINQFENEKAVWGG
uniref:Uncharacterized protein n=1 Tax=Dulem virus 39 TaxID=3145757 RepID=A0AAU8B7H1_9CAUD